MAIEDEAEDIPTARELLEEIRAVADNRKTWRWLCDSENRLESYEQLDEKLWATFPLPNCGEQPVSSEALVGR